MNPAPALPDKSVHRLPVLTVRALAWLAALVLAQCGKESPNAHPQSPAATYRSADGTETMEIHPDGMVTLTRGGVADQGQVRIENGQETVALNGGQSYKLAPDGTWRAANGRQLTPVMKLTETQLGEKWEHERLDLMKKSEAGRRDARANLERFKTLPAER